MSQSVRLRCVEEGRKLRVRIIGAGYNNWANCQFPRDIRMHGREYLVPSTDIVLAQGPNGKFFYRIGKKNIQIAEPALPGDVKVRIEKVFGADSDECCICTETTQLIIFAPCGHTCTCSGCSLRINTCPLCRGLIGQRVTRDQLQMD